MTTPALALNVRARGRHYPYPPCDTSTWPLNQWGSVDPDKIPDSATMLPSVTNVTGMLDKPGLLGWAAECAIREMYAEGSFPRDVEAAVRNHKSASNRARDKRAEAGTRAHTLAEALTSDTPLPDRISEEDAAYADAYLKWWVDHDPTPVHVEATVYGAGYAGTADLIAEVDGYAGIVDYKTKAERPSESKRKRYGVAYDEHRLQSAALAHASQVAVYRDGWVFEPMPPISWGLIVVLYPDGSYDTERLETPDLVRWYDGFLGLLRAWRAIKGWS